MVSSGVPLPPAPPREPTPHRSRIFFGPCPRIADVLIFDIPYTWCLSVKRQTSFHSKYRAQTTNRFVPYNFFITFFPWMSVSQFSRSRKECRVTENECHEDHLVMVIAFVASSDLQSIPWL